MPSSHSEDEASPQALYEACGIPLRRSQRPAWSCTECTRRKIKCSKQVPCTACDRKKRGHLCRVEPHGPATSLRNAARLISECNPDLRLASGMELDHLRASVSDLQHRVLTLESVVERILPFIPEGARPEFEPPFTGHSQPHSQPTSHSPHFSHAPPPPPAFPHYTSAQPSPFIRPPPPQQRAPSRVSGTGHHTPNTDSGMTNSPPSPHGSPHERDGFSDSEAMARSHMSNGSAISGRPYSPAPSPPHDVKPMWTVGSADVRRVQVEDGVTPNSVSHPTPSTSWAPPTGMMTMDDLGSGLMPQAGVPMYGFPEALTSIYGSSPAAYLPAAQQVRAGAY